MKKFTYTLVFFSLLSGMNLLAQDGENEKPNVSGVYVEFGRRGLEVTPGLLQFDYVDDSPSRDNFATTIDIGSDVAYDLGVGLVNDLGSVSFEFGVRGILGQVNGIGADLALGYNLVKTRFFHIRPTGTLGFGGMGMFLGDVENNALYIQVNDTQFYSPEVSVRVRNYYLGFKPALELGFYTPFLPIQSLNFELGYNFIAPFKSELKFSGDGETDNSLKDFEELDDENVNFLIDGELSDGLPVKYSGIYFAISCVLKQRR